MTNFETALTIMREGCKVRRKAWGYSFYLRLNPDKDEFLLGDCEKKFTIPFFVSSDDLIATDWIVCEAD